MRLILCLFTAAFAVGATPSFTLDQILSRPFASELVAGPSGRLAWIVNLRGVRNVYVAEAPEYRGRAVTKFAEDDGQEIGALQWMPDGSGVVFIRGGDLEHSRSEIPNPLSRPEGVDQGVWLATLDGNSRKLADGGAVAPVSNPPRVVFTKGNQVFTIGTAAGDKPVTLAQPRGGATGIAAAPDGSAIAFVSTRQDHSFIGVYRFEDKSLRYLDASVDTDTEPAWSPDSKSVAFVRVAALSRQLGGPHRSAADPWSIRIADARTGQGREVWKAQPGPGSAFHPIAEGSLLWAASNRLVFPWERDGWAHLYSVSTGGGDAALLTPGAFEVEHATLSANGREVAYSSNQDDIDRRHVWRVGVAPGSRPVAVTSGAGIEWSPVALEGGVAYLRSDARMPAQATVQMGSGTARDMAPELVPPDFPAAALVDPQPVILAAADGMPIHAQLFLPLNAGGEKRPAVIFFHGGSRRQMLLGWHYMYYYNNAYALNQYLASQGYIVLSVNYRSGIGYGLNFREAIDYGISGASEYNDVIGAGLYLRNRPDVDPKRIGLWGGSYGGYLTALGLARGSDLFAAGVDFHGVHDWSKLRAGDAASPESRTAFESSPMASVKNWRSPVLLIHGDDDRNVPFAETVRLVEALRAQKVDFEQLIFPDEIHDFLKHAHWLRAYQASADFLGRKLR
jgi:dipeptidyl aminopeptidase/acylaminoacyl peptidase